MGARLAVERARWSYLASFRELAAEIVHRKLRGDVGLAHASKPIGHFFAPNKAMMLIIY